MENDGFITADSLRKFLAFSGVLWNEQQAKDLIDEYDFDPRDGKLSLREFQTLILPFYYEQTKISPEKNRSKELV